jgi:cell division protein FtsQ
MARLRLTRSAGTGTAAHGGGQAPGRPGRWLAGGQVAMQDLPGPAEPGSPEPAFAAAGPPRPGRGPRRTPDPRRTALFGALVLAILIGAGWALLGSSLLVVRHEQVTGNRLVPAAEVLAAAHIRRGTPLESVNTAAAARRVERIAQVLSATVSRSWPDTIVIAVRERTPELAVPSAGGFGLIDADGVMVRWMRHRPSWMPLLISPSPLLPGSPGLRAAVSVLRQLPRSLRGLIESVSAPAANAVTFRLRGGITVVWGGPALTPAKAAELTVLLRTHARYYDVSDPSTAVTQR